MSSQLMNPQEIALLRLFLKASLRRRLREHRSMLELRQDLAQQLTQLEYLGRQRSARIAHAILLLLQTGFSHFYHQTLGCQETKEAEGELGRVLEELCEPLSSLQL